LKKDTVTRAKAVVLKRFWAVEKHTPAARNGGRSRVNHDKKPRCSRFDDFQIFTKCDQNFEIGRDCGKISKNLVLQVCDRIIVR